VLLFLLLGACGLHSVPLQRDLSLERDAVGCVTFWKTKAGKTRVDIEVYRLALTRHELVVWLQPKQGTRPEKLGSLRFMPEGDMWTQNAFLKAQTPHTEFDVFLTEDSEHAQSPRNHALLWASVRPAR